MMYEGLFQHLNEHEMSEVVCKINDLTFVADQLILKQAEIIRMYKNLSTRLHDLAVDTHSYALMKREADELEKKLMDKYITNTDPTSMCGYSEKNYPKNEEE